jgi:hypothetical protein
MRGLWVAGLTSLIALAVAVPQAVGATKWSRPFTLTESTRGSEPVTARAPGGRALVAWYDHDSGAIWARRIGRDGAPGPKLRISARVGNFGVGLDVALSDGGTAVVIWEGLGTDGGRSLHARRIGAGRRLGAVRTVASGPALSEARVAVDRRGAATIVWDEVHAIAQEPKGEIVTRAEIRVRRLDPAGRVGPVVELPPEGVLNRWPRLAVSPSGAATVAWVAQVESGGYQIRAVTLTPRGGIRGIEQLSTPQTYWSANTPEVVAGRGGDATVAWSAPSADGMGSVAFARVLSPGGKPGPLQVLADGSGPRRAGVTADTGREALVLWMQDQGSTRELRGRRVGIPGSTTPLWRLWLPLSASSPSVAVGASGRDVTAIWSWSNDVDVLPWAVRAQRLAASGRGGPVRTLVADRENSIWDPVVLAGSRDAALALWGRTARGRGSTIQAARLGPGSSRGPRR